MRNRSLLSKSLCLLFGLCLSTSFGFGKGGAQQAVSLISAADYGKVLDLVFADPPQKSVLEYAFVLRFMSSRHAESEIAVQVSSGGQVRAVLKTVSGASVWATANDYMQRTGRPDLRDIAQRVHLARQSLDIPKGQASAWHTEALKALGSASGELQHEFDDLQKTGEATIFLDGSTYELRFSQGTSEVLWIVMDAEVNDHDVTARSSLARWMNSVRIYFLSHVAK